MPGYVIHLAIAKEYLKINKEKNIEEFLEGNIYPDLVKPKKDSHYGESPKNTNLKSFLENNDINTSFKRGHFLHLIADYIFYNKYILEIPEGGLYNDYDLTNKELIEKYNVDIPEKIKENVYFKEGKTKVLHLDIITKLIKEVSVLNLEQVKKETLNNEVKWNTFIHK